MPLQTLSHVLLECPVAREVWEWFAGKWRQLVPGFAVALGNQRVLLLDELAAEHVPQALRPLWTHLRLLLLKSLWCGRGDDARGRAPQTAASIQHHFLAELRQQVANDWQRTLHDIRWNAGVPASWFRGRSPELEIAEFKQLWCVGGVIAGVTATPAGAAAMESSRPLVRELCLGVGKHLLACDEVMMDADACFLTVIEVVLGFSIDRPL